MDDVFKALADPNRRKILDIVHSRPGINVNELTEHFEFSRYNTMKHLKLLESAKLVTSKREWNNRLLYLNAVPIQMIYDRWITKFSGEWASKLTKIKSNLETKEKRNE